MSKTVEKLEEELQEALANLGRTQIKFNNLEERYAALTKGFYSGLTMLRGARMELAKYCRPELSEEEAFKDSLCGPYSSAISRLEKLGDSLHK